MTCTRRFGKSDLATRSTFVFLLAAMMIVASCKSSNEAPPSARTEFQQNLKQAFEELVLSLRDYDIRNPAHNVMSRIAAVLTYLESVPESVLQQEIDGYEGWCAEIMSIVSQEKAKLSIEIERISEQLKANPSEAYRDLLMGPHVGFTSDNRLYFRYVGKIQYEMDDFPPFDSNEYCDAIRKMMAKDEDLLTESPE